MSYLIDRQAVIDLLKQMRKDGDMVPWEGKDVFARIRKLPTIQPEKAQLSQEGTTKDTISRTETAEHLRRVLDATVPITDYDEGFVDGVEFGVSTVSTMPTIQPQSTTGQLNDGVRSTARSTELIDRQAAIDAAKDWYEGLICGSINGLIKRLNALPTAQPEPTYEQVEEYCKKRCLYVVTADFFESTKPQRLGHWIKHIDPFDGEQYECSECGVLWEFNDGSPEDNEAYFCPKCGAKMKGDSNDR